MGCRRADNGDDKADRALSPAWSHHACASKDGDRRNAGRGAGMVRSAGLRHVCRGPGQAVLPDDRSLGIATAQPRYFCAGLAGATDRGGGHRHVRRPRRSQARAGALGRSDDGWNVVDRTVAALCLDRFGGAAADDAGAPAARLLGGWRVRQRDRSAGRTGPGPPWLLRQPAMVGFRLCGIPGRELGFRHQLAADPGSGGKLGLAAAIPVRPADRPRGLVHP